MATGVSLGLAVITRPTTIYFAMASWVAVLVHRRWRDTLLIGLFTAVPLLLMAWYNVFYFGPERAVSGGYGHVAGVWMSASVEGLAGTLFAPSRGMFIYFPALLVLPWGLRALWRCNEPGSALTVTKFQRTLLICWLIAAGLTVVLYSQWPCWWGGWCYGPRFLCETMPILCLVVGAACASARTPIGRILGSALVVVSVVVHFLGATANDTDWKTRHPDGPSMFTIRDTQIEAHAREWMDLLRSP
jgi:hypothetical protein